MKRGRSHPTRKVIRLTRLRTLPVKLPVASLTVGLVAGGLAMAPSQASASPTGNNVVISEVYLNGGSSGATYANKYVELYNPADTAISLAGRSIQYRSATGTNAAAAVALTGSIP